MRYRQRDRCCESILSITFLERETPSGRKPVAGAEFMEATRIRSDRASLAFGPAARADAAEARKLDRLVFGSWRASHDARIRGGTLFGVRQRWRGPGT